MKNVILTCLFLGSTFSHLCLKLLIVYTDHRFYVIYQKLCCKFMAQFDSIWSSSRQEQFLRESAQVRNFCRRPRIPRISSSTMERVHPRGRVVLNQYLKHQSRRRVLRPWLQRRRNVAMRQVQIAPVLRANRRVKAKWASLLVTWMPLPVMVTHALLRETVHRVTVLVLRQLPPKGASEAEFMSRLELRLSSVGDR